MISWLILWRHRLLISVHFFRASENRLARKNRFFEVWEYNCQHGAVCIYHIVHDYNNDIAICFHMGVVVCRVGGRGWVYPGWMRARAGGWALLFTGSLWGDFGETWLAGGDDYTTIFNEAERTQNVSPKGCSGECGSSSAPSPSHMRGACLPRPAAA